MKKLFLFISFMALLCFACNKEKLEPDPPEELPGDQLARAEIGPEGGTLETDDFVLAVPQGAFDSTVTLSLYLIENDPSRLANQITSSYRLTGLNRIWNKTLEVSIRYESTPEDGNHIGFACPYYNEELEDTVQVHELYEAVDSLGFLRCFLPPPEDVEITTKSGMQISDRPHLLTFFEYTLVRGMKKVGTLTSAVAEIKYDKDISLSYVKAFADQLEEAVMFFHALGFIDANLFMGKYKLRVEALKEENGPSQAFYSEPDFNELKGLYLRSKNYFAAGVLSLYKIKFPSYYFHQINNELRKIAGQGVFRFGRYCYIPEGINWLSYAFRTWVDEYFFGSLQVPLNEIPIMHPFYGMNVVEMDAYENLFQSGYDLKKQIFHGSYMAPLITFLMDRHNPELDLMATIFEQMQTPSSFEQPINALLNSVKMPVQQWWPEFIKAYLEGEVRDIPAEMFMENIDAGDQLHFIDASDTVEYFDRSYPDLSARLCQVNLSRNFSESVLNEKDKLHFKLGPESLDQEYLKILVYGYKDDQLEFLSQGPEVTIEHVKGLIDAGYSTLLAVVVNSLSEDPYLEEVNIDLTVRILKDKKWPWSFLAVQAVVTDALFRAGDGSESTWVEYRFKIRDQEMEVSEEGTRFTASWLDQDADYKYEGGMDITLDKENFALTSFYLWSNSESYSEGKTTLSEKTTIRGKEGTVVPMVYSDDVYCYHQLEGQLVCPAIESFTYEYSSYPGESYEVKYTLESYSCLEDAELIFYWANRPIGIL